MKTRIISATLAAIISIPIILIGKYPFIIAVAIISILAFKEFLDLKSSHEQYPLLIKIIALILLLSLVLNLKYLNQVQPFLIIATLLLGIWYNEKQYSTKDALYLLAIIYLIGITFNLFIVFRLQNIYQFIYVISIPMATDIFAYFGGRFFGKHKLYEKLSPAKTWEGAIIGLLFGIVIGTLIYSCLVGSFSFKLVFLTAILSIIGQLGDLFFSKIKRENKIKDFSSLMPGHGGILDRIDSVMFVILAYAALLFAF